MRRSVNKKKINSVKIKIGVLGIVSAIVVCVIGVLVFLNHEKESNLIENQVLGVYQYPENPPEAFHHWMEKEIERGQLPLSIGPIETESMAEADKLSFEISMNDQLIGKVLFNENIGSKASFDIALRDPLNEEIRLLVVTSLFQYIKPDLKIEEAATLAKNQDSTLSIDGYSMPVDLSGYQIQSRYTAPYPYLTTVDYDNYYGIQVRALEQLWEPLDVKSAVPLTTDIDYAKLDEDKRQLSRSSELVYGTFKVKEIVQDESYLHGETWQILLLESPFGKVYQLSVDTMRYNYEFGVEQEYTIYIDMGINKGIVFAIQKSESKEGNRRGQIQPLDYPSEERENPLIPIEIEKDKGHQVNFRLHSRIYSGNFMALDGQGLGESQWPKNPRKDNYEFLGWYDNEECLGNPFHWNTPIFKDTYLYAKWKYTGQGGYWPREFRGVIEGLDESTLKINEAIKFSAKGYNMDLKQPRDQRFRWKPIGWKVDGIGEGFFMEEGPYEASITIKDKGSYTLWITYEESIFDGIGWQKTGQVINVKEKFFSF